MCRSRAGGERLRTGKLVLTARQKSANGIVGATRWVVDIDLEAFFDRVNHDRLMVRVRKHVDAPDVLQLINRFLKGGVQVNGQTQATVQGVPQGGPLSPVLANVVLDELDWALDARGHCFARYADDCNIFVKSQTMGQRGIPRVKETRGHCARGLEHKQKRAWAMAPEQNASTESGTARKVVSSNGVARTGTGQGNMRSTTCQGTAGYVTRMSGGVGGRGREASSYPD